MPIEIVQKNDKVLRQKSGFVPVNEIGSSKIKKSIADMKEAMHSQPDAVAIAAPQINVPLRIFVVSGKALKIIRVTKNHEVDEKEPIPPDQVFINPKILKLSKEAKYMEEGCLSVRYLYGKVKRSTKAIIEAYDEKGKKFKRGGSGLLAQIFQHETDHLDGKLFIDRAIEVVDLPPEKREDWKKKNRPGL